MIKKDETYVAKKVMTVMVSRIKHARSHIILVKRMELLFLEVGSLFFESHVSDVVSLLPLRRAAAEAKSCDQKAGFARVLLRRRTCMIIQVMIH